MAESLQLITPSGRLVMGSLMTKGTKDQDGRPIPEDKQRYFFGLAVPKSDPGFQAIWESIYNVAATAYAANPMIMQQIEQGFAAREFSWKLTDGDVPLIDKKTGQPRETRDHIVGHFIIKFSTMFEIDACAVQGNDVIQVNRADIKIGDYADVVFNVASNEQVGDRAGVYLNPVAIRRLGYGDAISTQISAVAAFSGHAAHVPAGAAQMPTAGGAMPPAGTAPAVGNAAPPATMPNQQYAPPAQAGAPVAGAVLPVMPTVSPSSGVPPHPGILGA